MTAFHYPQAHELTALNASLQSSAEYIHKCEAEISGLQHCISSQPSSVRDLIGKAANSTAITNLGDVAYQRKFEVRHREEMEALARQLMETERRLEVQRNTCVIPL